jgi:hypothetical protein
MPEKIDPDTALLELIRSHIGDVSSVTPTARGFGTDLAAVVE